MKNKAANPANTSNNNKFMFKLTLFIDTSLVGFDVGILDISSLTKFDGLIGGETGR